MVRTLLVVFAAVCFFQYTWAVCDPKTIAKIKELRKGIDDSNVLTTLQGTYTFKLVSFGAATPIFAKECLTAKFSDNTVEYSGAAEGKFDIKYKDGVLVVIDDGLPIFNTYVVYSIGKTVSLYTCSPGDAKTTFAFSAVAVEQSALSTASSYIKEAEAALGKIDVTGLVPVPPCS